MSPNALSSAESGALLEEEQMDDSTDAVAESRTSREAMYGDIENILNQAANGRNQYLHPKTAARWFRETLEQDHPRTYFEKTIRPRMQEAEATRLAFDDVTDALKQKGPSSGFTILDPNAFWKLPSEERKDYLEQAKEYLKGPKNFEARWKKIADEVRSFVKITFDELGSASSHESKALLEGLNYKPQDEAELEGWETYVNGLMRDQIKAARHLYFNELMDPLLKELKNKTISERVLKEMDKKFRDKNVDYKSKEAYIRTVLPERIKEWQSVKAKRDDLCTTLKNDPQKKRLVASKVKNLHIFLNEKSFANQTFPKRKGQADLIDSILTAEGKDMEQLHDTIRIQLDAYVADGRLHPSKVGTWLQRIFSRNDTPHAVRVYMQDTVYPNAIRWQQARQDFDVLNRSIKEKGIPRGMHQHTLDQFLLLNYPQRATYLEEATMRLNSSVNDPGELNRLTFRIRHSMDTHDWEEAEELLEKAKEMDPDNLAVQSIDRFLRAHRPKIAEEKESKEADELLTELRSYRKHIPGMMGDGYQNAMERGPEATRAFCVGTFNRVWVHEHHYSTPEKDRKEAHSDVNKAKTKYYIGNGHTSTIEHNILNGDTAKHQAVNDECVAAQILHIGDKDGCMTAVDEFEEHQNDEPFLYWSTLHFADVSYAQHRLVVRNYNYKIKTAIRALDELGYKFTIAGPAEKKAA